MPGAWPATSFRDAKGAAGRKRPPAPSIHVLAAVDRQRRARHEPGIVGGEESHAPGDLLGMTEPADGYPRDDFLEHRLRNGGDHLGIDITRRDGVHGHAE